MWVVKSISREPWWDPNLPLIVVCQLMYVNKRHQKYRYIVTCTRRTIMDFVHETPLIKNYRTVDQVFILKTIINKYIYKEKRKVYACFVDFKKAFDSVLRSALFIKLQSFGIRGKLYNIIHDLYSNTLFACKDSTHHSNPFLANQGVKQWTVWALLC